MSPFPTQRRHRVGGVSGSVAMPPLATSSLRTGLATSRLLARTAGQRSNPAAPLAATAVIRAAAPRALPYAERRQARRLQPGDVIAQHVRFDQHAGMAAGLDRSRVEEVGEFHGGGRL